MSFGRIMGVGARSGWLAILLFVAVLAAPAPSLAQSAVNCNDPPYNGVIELGTRVQL